MTDVLRIAHPQNCPPYGNSRVGICEGNLKYCKKTNMVLGNDLSIEECSAVRWQWHARLR